jgi:putative chitobiose transport system permease protein
MAPALIIMLAFSIIPSFMALGLSFTDYNVFQKAQWVGLDNYRTILRTGEFWNVLRNTLSYWLLVTPVLVTVPVFVAALVNREMPGIKFYRLLFYFPVLVSVVITALIWGWMFQSNGILNYLLGLIGLGPVRWLTRRTTVLPSLALVTIWQGLGYYMLFYLAGMQSISLDVYEAAELDGATNWKKHIYITFPLLRPVIFFTTVISTMAALKEFTLMMTMTGGGPIGASKTVVYLVFEEAFENLEMGYASAISFLLFAVILVLTIINKTTLDKEQE